MKILLRNSDEGQYVWKTAKYDFGKFYVNGDEQHQGNVVSIVNDNRKKYVKCSSCGKVFRRGDYRFEEHKANAIKPETCFGCSHLCTEDRFTINRKFVMNMDGTFTEIMENSVRLQCDRSGLWSYYDIDNERVISKCQKRQCGNATEMEISDFFTQYPGVFDDIITIDGLLDAGYNVGINSRGDSSYDIEWGLYYTLCAIINTIGIVDRFNVWFDGDKYTVYYSKKYKELFTEDSKCNYIKWDPIEMSEEVITEIKNNIKKLYR